MISLFVEMTMVRQNTIQQQTTCICNTQYNNITENKTVIADYTVVSLLSRIITLLFLELVATLEVLLDCLLATALLIPFMLP